MLQITCIKTHSCVVKYAPESNAENPENDAIIAIFTLFE